MAWRTAKVEEQRVHFVLMVSKREKSFTQACQEFQISRPTGYKWWKRFMAAGVNGLQDRSRRPHSSPHRIGAETEETIEQLRKQRPDWGARKLQPLLQRQGIPLPVSSIHRVLLRRDMVKEGSRHRPAVKRFAREAPNQLWQMDFKGPKHWNQGVGPLTVLDDHSRYLLALQGNMTTSGERVQAVLERVFEENGLPDQMLMDHGCPWWNEQGYRGWTRLAVWLMKQDIGLCFSGYNHPQTQGKVEHLHRSLTHALRCRGIPKEDQRQVWLDSYRYEHNHVRPHEALQMKTPSQVWRHSERRYQLEPPEWKYPDGYGVAEIQKGGETVIERQHYWISGALAGERVGWVECDNRILVFYRKTLIRELQPGNRTTTRVNL